MSALRVSNVHGFLFFKFMDIYLIQKLTAIENALVIFENCTGKKTSKYPMLGKFIVEYARANVTSQIILLPKVS